MRLERDFRSRSVLDRVRAYVRAFRVEQRADHPERIGPSTGTLDIAARRPRLAAGVRVVDRDEVLAGRDHGPEQHLRTAQLEAEDRTRVEVVGSIDARHLAISPAEETAALVRRGVACMSDELHQQLLPDPHVLEATHRG